MTVTHTNAKIRMAFLRLVFIVFALMLNDGWFITVCECCREMNEHDKLRPRSFFRLFLMSQMFYSIVLFRKMAENGLQSALIFEGE